MRFQDRSVRQRTALMACTGYLSKNGRINHKEHLRHGKKK